ncbi:MAG: helix-hairpin-helix domain-containing protein, partial [Anaerolineae bacterium]
MNNQEVAKTFETLADMLDVQGEENKFKIIAYRRVAEQIANLDRDINALWQTGELRSVPGVGQAIEEKIDALLKTGAFDLYARLQKQIPAGVVAMLTIPDMGPKRVKMLWQEAGVTSVDELEKKARAGQLAGLPGLGKKFEEKIIANIAATKRRGSAGRSPLGVVYPLAHDMLSQLMRAEG